MTPGSGMPPLPLHDRGRDTVASVLEGHAARRPDAPFLLFEQESGGIEQLSWAEMDRRAEAAAAQLAEFGVSAGETFNVHLQNRPEFFQLWFAAAKLGAAVVPTNPLASADELGYQLADSGCRLSVTQPDLAQTVEQARAQAPDCAQVLVTGQPWPRGQQPATRTSPGPTDVLGILYTSGTTSRPKGVMVTHAAYLHVGDAVAGHLRLRPDDRQLVVLPLFHGNAQYYSTCSALVTGASIALTPGFSASRWSVQAARMGATVASLFAAPIRMILAAAQAPEDREHALRAVMFAQNVTDEQVEAFESRFGAPLIQLYGMTETVVPVTMNPLYEQRRGDSIGRPLPSAQLRIADPDDVDVATGDAGQLLVGGIPGRTMLHGYLNKPEATTEALAGGWFHTGDTVTADEDGYIYFVDRAKDMIKRAGENIASAEVERVLNDHPAVYESAVIGISDQMRDEAIHAFVATNDEARVSADELHDWCAARLSVFKVPDAFEFRASLPRTSVGKIQKHQLRPRPGDETDADHSP